MSDKSNAVTDDEFVETDELLASIPVEAEAMDLAEADGFMTAVQLLPKTPETKDWLPHILSTVGAKDAGTGNAASDSERCSSNASIKSEISWRRPYRWTLFTLKQKTRRAVL